MESNSNEISYNIISNNGEYGVKNYGSGSVYNNIIINHSYGIYGGPGNISRNEIKDNELGLYLTRNLGVTVEKNNFIDNGLDATFFYKSFFSTPIFG